MSRNLEYVAQVSHPCHILGGCLVMEGALGRRSSRCRGPGLGSKVFRKWAGTSLAPPLKSKSGEAAPKKAMQAGLHSWRVLPAQVAVT